MSVPRLSATAGYYHVANRARKEALFTQRDEFIGFLAVLEQGVRTYQIPLAAYCVMKRRWHLLVGPMGKQRLFRFVEWVAATQGGADAILRSRQLGRQTFDATALSDASEIVPMSRYIERLPLSAGLVRRAEDWPWSSLHQRLGGSARVPLTAAPVLASAAWCHYVNTSVTPRECAREDRRNRTELDRKIRRPPLAIASGE